MSETSCCCERVNSSSFYSVLGIIPSACGLSDTSLMSFSLDKPGFLASADVSQEASRDSPPPPPSAGSSTSAFFHLPQLSESRRRMSKPVFDHRAVVFNAGVLIVTLRNVVMSVWNGPRRR